MFRSVNTQPEAVESTSFSPLPPLADEPSITVRAAAAEAYAGVHQP